MLPDYSDFVHAAHVEAFIEAARTYRCHILVRKTGRASLKYVARAGYVGKRADLKAKTAARDLAPYELAGLVCSPYIHSNACKPDAMKAWAESAHLVTMPRDGFDDNVQPRGCHTPYILQTNRLHKHYGCVALVENGLLTPRYVHGDYDLYAIIPAGSGAPVGGRGVQKLPMVATMDPPRSMMLEQRLRHEALLKARAPVDHAGPLTLEVANFLNVKMSHVGRSVFAGLMVNHGEHINKDPHDYQEVLAFMAQERGGSWARILRSREDHEAFYRGA
jgi:hypothetical protein